MDKKIYLSIYFITYFAYGILFSSFGPIVPFLSFMTHLPESHFTIIFTMRGLGYLLGGVVKHIFFKSFDFHRGASLGCFGVGIGSLLFVLSQNIVWMGILSLEISICLFLMDIFVNISILERGKDEIQFNMGLSFTFISLGNIIGPVLVSYFGVQSFFLMGISFVLLSVVYFCIPEFTDNSSEQTQEGKVIISGKGENYLCLIFMMYAAFTLSFRSWISSFSVLLQIQSKEDAALVVSLYSIFQLSLRTIFTFIKISVIKTLRICSLGSIVYSPLIFFMFFCGFRISLLYTSAIGIALLMFIYFPFLYALPDQFNKRLTTKNTSKMMTCYAIGQSVFSSFGGYLMDWIHPLALFGYMFIVSIFQYIGFEKSVYHLGQKGKEQKLQIPLQQF